MATTANYLRHRESLTMDEQAVNCGRCGRVPTLSMLSANHIVENPWTVQCSCGRVIPRFGAATAAQAIATWNARTALIAAANKGAHSASDKP